ncbi:late expression factor-8 [Maruca vitrata nucleopolyhedrovirus]|uniref:DNA-directed RNA polymerase n=1 Tax=Maruca vitrata nucleopolyhedrovirus TaxID=1307954 RepID=A1YR97_9ABAC|nr:late expression factor-8 [Maruca vitrata nucleopolyhedrovirus]ABL75987.1 late expression factor-8 [Maruca vitrata nucleopolyhedrovirus]
MTDVVQDFNELYERIENKYKLKFTFDCATNCDESMPLCAIQERKSYLCCALNEQLNCVLHKCVPVIFGTRLDKQFRESNDADANNNIKGTFMLDGRFLSFPNIMMNNNILVHNFYDKLYAKHCKRMFLYGNVDQEKHINRAIQLVYDKQDDILFARDVYASDYVVTEDLNSVLETYLANSGKWKPLDFLFEYNALHKQQLVEHIKIIMNHDINYSIDSLANKIVYKHAYLMELLLTSTILQNYQRVLDKAEAADSDTHTVANKRRKIQSVLYNKESKKIVDCIVNGRLIYCVSKTFSKQRKVFPNQQDNSSNNNIEISLPVLKYRVGNEVARITNDSMRQKMLKQKKDFVKFIGSFFHGEMTVAGKKFFLCRNARLPNVDYEMVAQKFQYLLKHNFVTFVDDLNDVQNDSLLIAFNDRPTNLKYLKSNTAFIVYTMKRNMSPIELKITDKILYVNHHEGMVCIKKQLRVNNETNINVLLTPYEYHYKHSIYYDPIIQCTIVENDDVKSLMSKLEQYYYHNFIHLFHTIPIPKLIVSLTNLKNAMPVFEYKEEISDLPNGYSVGVNKSILLNNKMFKLWTLVRDNKLMTAEDPYIPHMALPICLYNNKINKLKGKLAIGPKQSCLVKFTNSTDKNYVALDDGLVLYMAGVLVSEAKINWVYDGRRYKIETCTNGNFNVYKVYVYFRQIKNQKIENLDASMVVSGDNVMLKIVIVTSTNDLEGIKICGIHGQKGVFNRSEDLTEWMAEDGTHAQICLSPVSFLSRQSNFDKIERKYVVRGGNHDDPQAKRYPIFNIPYMLFNNTPDNIFKEFIKTSHTGHEKVEGTRFDQWTKNQSFVGNRMSESLHWMRGGSNLPQDCGEFNVVSSLLMCNNTIMKKTI